MSESKAQLFDSLDQFNDTASDEQLEAINNRNLLLALSLGVTLDQYIYRIDPSYRWKLSTRLV